MEVLESFDFVAKLLDEISFLLMNLWLTIFSRFFSCYISTIYEKQHPQCKLMDYFVFGPLYGVLLILTLPFGVIGILIWIVLCEITKQEKFAFESYEEDEGNNCLEVENDVGVYTLASANVLLAPEAIARLNNIKYSYDRTKRIADKIKKHTGRSLDNLRRSKDCDNEETSKFNSILSEFPNLDFLCLQEVWERTYGVMLIERLKKEFSYFLYDVGEYSWQKNYCMLGSGLFFASKKLILDADFHTFTFRTKQAKFTSQGVLCVKVLLHYDHNGRRHVGYIANVHTQAFQGNDAVLLSQFTDILIFVTLFKDQKTQPGDVIDFDIVCGDFNSDNMSPGDLEMQQHSLFQEYQDVCVQKVGLDRDWAIGTELRQTMLSRPDIEDPEDFREILIDDSLRREYVLDADVLVHSAQLVTSVATPGLGGYVESLPHGGKRRIDKILYRGPMEDIVGYCFLSALTNLTDHLPVCMTISPSTCKRRQTEPRTKFLNPSIT